MRQDRRGLEDGSHIPTCFYRGRASVSSTAAQYFIFALLRANPRWCRGHLLLGEWALEQGEIGLAFGCGLAIRELRGAGVLRERAEWLLARTYLRNGQGVEAQPILERLTAHSGNGILPEELSQALRVAADIQGNRLGVLAPLEN